MNENKRDRKIVYVKNMKKLKKLRRRYYIKLGARRISVKRNVYYAYKRPVWREAKKMEVRIEREISYDLMVENGFEVIYENQEHTDDRAIRNIIADKFWNIFEDFTDKEKELIYELYVKDKKQTDTALKMKLSDKTISVRKDKLLTKCKEILNSDEYAQIIEFFG